MNTNWLRKSKQFLFKGKVLIHVILNKNQTFRLKDFSIVLPPRHPLLYYTFFNPRYDRFIFHLTKQLIPGELAVDVGANVGDTLAIMVEANPHLKFFCVDGEPFFYGFLIRNIIEIKKAFPNIDIGSELAILGDGSPSVGLKIANGTASLNLESPIRAKSVTLDALVTNNKLNEIRFLKTDTDGFDFMVLESGLKILNEAKPILLFELQFSNDDQLQGYVNLLGSLDKFHYTIFLVFDNFGELICRVQSISQIYDLMEYITNQHIKKTIYYLDIVAATENDTKIIDDAVESFRLEKFSKS